MLVVGEREAQGQSVSVRHRRLGDLGVMAVDRFAQAVAEEIRTRSLESVFGEPEQAAAKGGNSGLKRRCTLTGQDSV